MFLFVVDVLTELMLFVLNNQITKAGRGLRTCALNVTFFLISWKLSKRRCFSKQTTTVILEDEQMNCWMAVLCVGMGVLQHQYHWKKSRRVYLSTFLYSVYLLGDGCFVLNRVMTFHIVKTKLFNLYCSLPSCIYKPLDF